MLCVFMLLCILILYFLPMSDIKTYEENTLNSTGNYFVILSKNCVSNTSIESSGDATTLPQVKMLYYFIKFCISVADFSIL